MSWFVKNLFAVDIGTRTLKGLKLKKSRGKISIASYFFHDLLKENDSFPVVADLSDKLKSLIAVNALAHQQVITCLQDLDMLNQDVTLPDMPKADLEVAIKNNLEEHFNLPAEQARLAYVKLESKDKNGVLIHKYKIYGAHQERVDSQIQTLQDVGLRPKIVDSSVLAQVAMLKHNEFIEADKCYGLLEIGDAHSTISLIVHDKVHLINVLPIGVGSINKLLFETMGISYERAELLKFTYDLEERSGQPDEIQQHCDEVFNELFYRMQRIVGFFKVYLKDEKIKSLLITGGGSQVKNLDKHFEANFGLPTVIVNPFKNIEIINGQSDQQDKLGEIAPYMATAVGLALRGLV